jgi:hypothetical protein
MAYEKSQVMFDFTVTYKHHTHSAILVTLDNIEIWLPFSQITLPCDPDELVRDEQIEILVPEWLAIEKEIECYA